MGAIEDTIFENYRKSISKGNFKQAKLAVELAKELVTKVESTGFIDYKKKPEKTNEFTRWENKLQHFHCFV